MYKLQFLTLINLKIRGGRSMDNGHKCQWELVKSDYDRLRIDKL